MKNGHPSPFLHWYRKLSDSLPFEPDNFLQITRPRIIAYTKGQGQKKKYSLKDYKRLNVWYWKANVRKIEFQKTLSSPRKKNRSEQEQNTDNEKEIKRNGEFFKKMRDEWKDNET